MFPWSCAVCGEEGLAGHCAAHAGIDFWSNRREQRRSVRAVPYRLARLRIYVVAVLRAGTVRWASTRHSRWVHTTGTSATMPAAQARAQCLAGPVAQRASCRGAARCDQPLPPDAWVVPVPLHWWRRCRRGYNQAEALAEGLARRLNLPVHRLLKRVVATEQLAHKGVPRGAKVMRRCLSRPA